MLKTLISGALLLVFAPALLAQGGAAVGQDTELKKEFAELQKAYFAAQQKYYEPYRLAKTEEEASKIQLDPAKDPDKEFLPKFRAFAAKAGNNPAAADAYLQIAQFRSPAAEKDVDLAFEKLTTTFVKLPILESVAGMLVYSYYFLEDEKVRMSRILPFLDRIEKNGTDASKAAAMFARASVLEQMKSVPDQEAKITAILDSLIQRYPESRAAKQAKGKIFETKYLSVGKVAPDFTATDENGVEFKLSDYRGKVVVLDFWGFW